ncbi:MAG TPA: glycosyltransferase [Candidatus Limnocylindrales bacterium]|nr:glycosyltransferase [Candidatus Limnocylindrales bacterium]
MLPVLFWVATGLLLWVYLGYPLAAWLASRLGPFRLRGDAAGPGLVTVGIAAFNEAGQLAERIGNVLDQAVSFELEVIVASDGSTDGSAALVEQLAASDGRIRLLDLPRGGQTAAQRAIFEAARGEVVVLTDAETRFAAGCLAALVAPFEDPRVGAATGRLAWLDGDRTETARNEGVYWRYEQWVRRLESRAGWLTAVTGALLAVRASAYRAVPDHASMDHLLPLEVRDQGLVVLAVPEAVASDRTVGGLREQFRNRSRTATRGIRANLSMAGRLTPWRRPSAFLAIWSHKVLRWATPLLAAVAGGAALALTSGGESIWFVPVGLGLAVVVLAGLGWLLRAVGRPLRIGSLPLAIVVVNLAFLTGWWNLVRGRRIEAWHREHWSAVPAGTGPAASPRQPLD